MSFTDIFKNSFLEETTSLTLTGFLLSISMAFICGMVIYFVYRTFFRGVVYNENFNILLVLTAMVTCFVVIVISSNVVLSLGMVGALSIVRFRTAVKDPLDVGFIFWAVATGITSGAGLYMISIYAVIVISLVFILLSTIRSHKSTYLLIVKCQPDCVGETTKILSHVKTKLKNKAVTKNYVEMTYEVKTNIEKSSFMAELLNHKGVESAVMLEFSGDYSV